MNVSDLQNRLLEWTVAHSGAEKRGYLGMSSIGECPRELYRRMVENGQRDWSIEMHLNCYSGYLFERDVRARLQAIGAYAPVSEREIVADFDPRFRGHCDGELMDGRLLEIKSTVQANLDGIMASRRIPRRHFEQVQMYLHHGHYPAAVVVYVARDTGQMYVAEIRPAKEVVRNLNEKARRVLECVDRAEMPECECGKCGGQ